MSYQIAIDGPAGAGKSTIAKKISGELGFVYVDTGAMYRAMTLYFIRKGVGAEDIEAINENVQNVNISLEYNEEGQQVILNGENVNGFIRNEEVSMMTSKFSAYPVVREKLVSLQRELAQVKNVVMDGRDIGTCVLPDATIKIYLTASVEQRANRRYKEYLEKGIEADLEEIKADISKRDYNDMTREVSPLKQADDAVVVDSSFMTIDEVVNTIIDLFRGKCNA